MPRTIFCALTIIASLAISAVSTSAQIVANTLYVNITGDTTTAVKSGAGRLVAVCVNTAAATETITLYDSTAASGTKIGTITVYASTNPCFYYNVNFYTGLTVVTGTATGDITVAYQ